jgi:hypothetical protein
MVAEKTREARLRRLARRDGCVFHKVRTPYRDHGMTVLYGLVDQHSNNIEARWDCLEDAEAAFAARS